MQPEFMVSKFSFGSPIRWTVGAIVVSVACFIFLMPIGSPKEASKRTACLSNVKQMSLAALAYANDHDDKLPLAVNWMDSTPMYVGRGNYAPSETERVYHDVTFSGDQYGYAFRLQASSKEISSIKTPSSFALIFDSKLMQRNAGSGLETLPSPGRHQGRNSVGYLDGHAKSVTEP